MKRFKATAILLLALLMALSCFGLSLSGVSEEEILGTVYELDEMEMYHPHNNYSFKMWRVEDAAAQRVSAIEDADYVECDMWGSIDVWYAHDLSLGIIGYGYLHPSQTYQPVLLWTAPYDGRIEVYSNYCCPKDGEKKWDDPTEIFIFHNDLLLHSEVTGKNYVDNTQKLTVKAGDLVFWTISKIGDYNDDTTRLTTKIWYTSVNLAGDAATEQEPETDPVAEPETDPVTEPVTEPETDPVSEPVTEATVTERASAETNAPIVTSPSSPETEAVPQDRALSTGAIIGIAFAVVAAAAVILIIIKKKS